MKRFFFCIVALTLVSACSREPESNEPVFDLAAGEAIASADCSACHGMDGRGDTTEIPNLAAQPAEYLVESMHAYRDGRRHHAALQEMTSEMSEADIVNIAGYYASLPPLEAVHVVLTLEQRPALVPADLTQQLVQFARDSTDFLGLLQ